MGVISRLRGIAEQWGSSIVPLLSRISGNPNHYTIAGVIAALGAVLAAYKGLALASVALILLSGVMDAVDGLVARHMGRASRAGALVDSVSDRISDTLYHVALALLGVDPLPLILSLSASIITPYLRARGEALGVRMAGVGLVERQERVLIVAFIGLMAGYNPYYASMTTWILAAVAWITVAQRWLHIYRILSLKG